MICSKAFSLERFDLTMARTNRNGAPNASVQALDNLDLDDMFADGGDDLFDGLDIDLGNMDDIAGVSNEQSGEAQPPKSSSAEAPSPPPADTIGDEAPKRRKTKRRTTARSFFDEQDEPVEEEPVKKKKRTSTTATKKRGPKKAASAQDESKIPVSSANKKSKTKTGMPLPMAKGSSAGVGLAGQTGGRLKKLGAKNTTSKSSDSGPHTKASSSSSGPKALLSSHVPPHPGLNQSTFCGLLPSKTLFYPFLPSLPQEVTLKNRKIYALLDRVHTSFISQLSSPSSSSNGVQQAKPPETIVQLMLEAAKDEKSSNASSTDANSENKAETVGTSVATTRKTVESLEKTRLSQDLLAVCALLRRQHDFLKQNAANMERWCHDNLTEEEFAEVYLPAKSKRKDGGNEQEPHFRKSILEALSGSTFKVKVICTGFKEPKLKLQATIPAKQATIPVVDPKKASKPSKKRKSTPEETKVSATALTAQPVSYAQLRPAKRRKAVADLIAQTAQSLESDFLRKKEAMRQSFLACERRARDAAEDSQYPMAHTGGMWKWLEEMGYCQDTIDDEVLRERLEDIRLLYWQNEGQAKPSRTMGKALVDDHHIIKARAEPPPSYVDTLLDLLVDEDNCSDDGSDEISNEDEEDRGVGENHDDFRVSAELSELSPEERAHLHLRSVGLSRIEMVPDQGTQTRALGTTKVSHDPVQQPRIVGELRTDGDPNRNETSAADEAETVETLINNMKSDLLETTAVNNRRGAYLEAVVRSTVETPKESKSRKLVEAELVARHASIVKRNKETRTKNGKNKNAKNDDLGLPW